MNKSEIREEMFKLIYSLEVQKSEDLNQINVFLDNGEFKEVEKNKIKGLGICLENGAVELLPASGSEEGSCRIQLISCHSENELIQRLYDVRLILDVRDQPDLYLQIAGISAGIPQVNYRFTRYVQHQKDGYIIQNIHYISGALEYYMSGLKHWNEALVYCVKEIEKYTGGSLVQQWKEAVEDDAK